MNKQVENFLTTAQPKVAEAKKRIEEEQQQVHENNVKNTLAEANSNLKELYLIIISKLLDFYIEKKKDIYKNHMFDDKDRNQLLTYIINNIALIHTIDFDASDTSKITPINEQIIKQTSKEEKTALQALQGYNKDYDNDNTDFNPLVLFQRKVDGNKTIVPAIFNRSWFQFLGLKFDFFAYDNGMILKVTFNELEYFIRKKLFNYLNGLDKATVEKYREIVKEAKELEKKEKFAKKVINASQGNANKVALIALESILKQFDAQKIISDDVDYRVALPCVYCNTRNTQYQRGNVLTILRRRKFDTDEIQKYIDFMNDSAIYGDLCFVGIKSPSKVEYFADKVDYLPILFCDLGDKLGEIKCTPRIQEDNGSEIRGNLVITANSKEFIEFVSTFIKGETGQKGK